MEWISFHGPRRPINGQKIIYYGEAIGVWRGVYKINYEDKFCIHNIYCEDGWGNVDYMDSPWWQPDEGQPLPPPPSEPYPKDYPNYENTK
jgi:uncharacterized Fe-S cluster protein YjdI